MHYCYGTVSLYDGRHDFMLFDTINLELVYYEFAASRNHTILICVIDAGASNKHHMYFVGSELLCVSQRATILFSRVIVYKCNCVQNTFQA